jgi:hypothetical protein
MTGLRAGITVAAIVLTAGAAAQQTAPRAVPMRPPLFFSETWKPLPTPPDDHGAWPATQEGVSNPNLELTLYGTTAKEIQLVAGRGTSNVVPTNLWTGTTTTPSAVALRDRSNYVDLSAPLAKIRWVVRTSGFHQDWPIVKLADGRWLVGDRPSGLQSDFNENEITPTDLRWLKLDITRVVTLGTWIDHPDLKKVDAVGFADLLPGSGHGAGGYINVGRIDVYGTPVKR